MNKEAIIADPAAFAMQHKVLQERLQKHIKELSECRSQLQLERERSASLHVVLNNMEERMKAENAALVAQNSRLIDEITRLQQCEAMNKGVEQRGDAVIKRLEELLNRYVQRDCEKTRDLQNMHCNANQY